jgi:acyl carrier protein
MGIVDSEQIDPSEPLFNLGLDSLMALELMVLLEKNLGIKLTESLVFEYPTIEALAGYFNQELFPDDVSSAPATVTVSPRGVEADPATPATSESGFGLGGEESSEGRIQQELEAISAMDDDELLRQLRG